MGDLVVGDAGEGIGEPGLRVDAVELGGFDEGVGDGGGAAAGERACGEVVLPIPTETERTARSAMSSSISREAWSGQGRSRFMRAGAQRIVTARGRRCREAGRGAGPGGRRRQARHSPAGSPPARPAASPARPSRPRGAARCARWPRPLPGRAGPHAREGAWPTLALWTGGPVDGGPCGRGALWTGSPVAPPVRDPWRTDLRRTCRARRSIARRCHGRGPVDGGPCGRGALWHHRSGTRGERTCGAHAAPGGPLRGDVTGGALRPVLLDRPPDRSIAARPSPDPRGCRRGGRGARTRHGSGQGIRAAMPARREPRRPGRAGEPRAPRSTTGGRGAMPAGGRGTAPFAMGLAPMATTWLTARPGRTPGAAPRRRRRWSARLPSAGHDRGSAGAWARPRAPRDGAAARSSRRPGSR